MDRPITETRLAGNRMRAAVLIFMAREMGFDMRILYLQHYDHIITKPLRELPWEPLTDISYAALFRS